MALRDQFNVHIRADLYNVVPTEGTVITVNGNSSQGDIPTETWYYDANSSATDDGITVIKPTSVVGNGRHLKSSYSQVNADWNASSGAAQILNKPTIPAAQVNSDWTSTSGLSQILNKPVYTKSTASRSFNSSFQVSTTQNCNVRYSVQIDCALSLTTGQAGSIILETSPDNSTFTEQGRLVGSNTGTLSIGVNTTQIVGGQLDADNVPAGYWVRLRTINNTGTPTFTYNSGIEITY